MPESTYDVHILFQGLCFYYRERNNVFSQDEKVTVLLVKAHHHGRPKLYLPDGDCIDLIDVTLEIGPVPAEPTKVPEMNIPMGAMPGEWGLESHFQWIPNLQRILRGEKNAPQFNRALLTADLPNQYVVSRIQINGGTLRALELGRSSGEFLPWQFIYEGSKDWEQAIGEWVLLSYKDQSARFTIKLDGESRELSPPSDSDLLQLRVDHMATDARTTNTLHHFGHFYDLLQSPPQRRPLPYHWQLPDRSYSHGMAATCKDEIELMAALNAFCPPATWVE